MEMEHVALNVPEPVAMAAWYRDHLGLEIVRGSDRAPFTHFLRDGGGRMLIEIYLNPPDAVPDYRRMDPLVFHLAFVSADPAADAARLAAAGASPVVDQELPDGSRLVMMRDPWGVPLQLCRRAASLRAGGG